jgi:flagellar protein FliO/FliZ
MTFSRTLARPLLLLLVLGAYLPAMRAEEKVRSPEIIYPRPTPVDNGGAPGRPASGTNPTLPLLALGAAAAGGWLLWRQRRTPHGLTGREARKLAVTESRPLGNRQYLVVADYEGRKFLLGVCPGRIDLLSALEPGKEKAP